MAKIEFAEIEDGFRAKRKQWFLTYPRTPVKLTPQAFLGHIRNKVSESRSDLGLEKWLVVREKHFEDLKKPYHIHCYLDFSEPIETTNSRFWDVEFYNNAYHPHDGGAVRNKEKVLGYLLKDPVDKETNMEDKEILPNLLYAAKFSESDLDFWTSVFYQSSMKAGSFAALKAATIIRRLTSAGVKNLRELPDGSADF